jgi:hypothetical protein
MAGSSDNALSAVVSDVNPALRYMQQRLNVTTADCKNHLLTTELMRHQLTVLCVKFATVPMSWQPALTFL